MFKIELKLIYLYLLDLFFLNLSLILLVNCGDNYIYYF